MGISKVTRNFQVTLPRDIRKREGISVGDEVLFTSVDGAVQIVKLDEKAISNVAGLWSDEKETGLEFQKRVRDQWKKRTW